MTNEAPVSFRNLLIHFRRLPFNPFLAVLENLFLPDGHGLFQTVYRVTAGFKRYAAVWRGNDDHDGRFRNFQGTKTMDHADAFNLGPTLTDLPADAPHFLDGHRLSSFLLPTYHATPPSAFAHHPAGSDGAPV